MDLTVNFTSSMNNTCCNNKDNDKKHVTSEVATATGATAAGATAAKNGTFNMFRSAKNVKMMSKSTTDAVKLSAQSAKEAKGLLGAFTRTAKAIKASIVKWGETATNSKLLKPLLTNKLFRGLAGCLGAGVAVFITISGIGDIFNTFTNEVTRYKSSD